MYEKTDKNLKEFCTNENVEKFLTFISNNCIWTEHLFRQLIGIHSAPLNFIDIRLYMIFK